LFFFFIFLVVFPARPLAASAVNETVDVPTSTPDWSQNPRVRRQSESTIATNVLCAAAGFVPYVGSILCAILTIFWPESSTPDVFALIEQKVQHLVNRSILQFETMSLLAKLNNIQERFNAYGGAGNVERGSILATILHGCGEIYHHLQLSENRRHLVSQVILLGGLHIAVLNERNFSGAFIYPNQNRTTAYWESDLSMWRNRYTALLKQAYEEWWSWSCDTVTLTDYSWRKEIEVKDQLLDLVLYISPRYGDRENDCLSFLDGSSLPDTTFERRHARMCEEREQAAKTIRLEHLSKKNEDMLESLKVAASKTVYHVCLPEMPAESCYGIVPGGYVCRACRIYTPGFVNKALESHGFSISVSHNTAYGRRVAVVP